MAHPEFRCQVLLVEDNPVNTELVKAILEAVNCDLTAVADGLDALEAFKAHSFHLVLLDFHLPRMDGSMVARAMRAVESDRMARPTWIAALTGSTLPEGVQSCLDAGMDEVLSKPIDVIELRDMVANLCERQKAMADGAAC